MYYAIDIAEYIIHFCDKNGHPTNNMLLQYTLYLIQNKFLQINGKRFFADDFEAWAMGPVIPNVYYKYCHWGAIPIQKLNKNPEFHFKPNEIIIMNEIIQICHKARIHDLWEKIIEHDPSFTEIYKEGKGNKKTISIKQIQKYLPLHIQIIDTLAKG